MARNKIINDKSQIIDLAQRLLETEGVEAVSMRRLSKEMGVSSMTLYNYVHNAGDVMREIMIRTFGQLYEQIYAIMDVLVRSGIDGGVAYARAYATALYELAMEHRNTCMYLIGQGRTLFYNDAELRPFYHPFERLLRSAPAEKRSELKSVFRIYQYTIHSMLHELSSGMRSISREQYMEIIDLFLSKML